eukprot:6131026-Amphidinium_carterae.2
MRLLGGDGVSVRTPREMLSQFRILWPDRGELDTLAVCQKWAEQFSSHAGVFMKGGRFALRVPIKMVTEAKTACGQQSEEKYILRGIPLDADASDVDAMLRAVGWAATTTPTSRRVSQGTASFQVMAAHGPPKLGFHVKWGYLRCHVQVTPPRVLRKPNDEEKRKEKEDKAPRTWAQALRPAVFTEEPQRSFQWVAPDARKTKRDPGGVSWSDGFHPETADESQPWTQVAKKRKNVPEKYHMCDEDEDANAHGDGSGWIDHSDARRNQEGWEGYDDDDDQEQEQDGDDAHMDEECHDEEEEETEQGEGERRRAVGVDYAARNRIQIMNTQLETLGDQMAEMMSLIRGLTVSSAS